MLVTWRFKKNKGIAAHFKETKRLGVMYQGFRHVGPKDNSASFDKTQNFSLLRIKLLFKLEMLFSMRRRTPRSGCMYEWARGVITLYTFRQTRCSVIFLTSPRLAARISPDIFYIFFKMASTLRTAASIERPAPPSPSHLMEPATSLTLSRKKEKDKLY